MSLDQSGKIQNVKASVEKYIYDRLVTTSGLTIDWEGLPFESSGVSVWVQPRILGTGNRDFHRQVSGSTLGQTTQVLVNFNVFVNPELMAPRTNRHYQVRDKIANYFCIGKQIDLYDVGDWASSLQKMEVDEIITDRTIPDPDFYQYNYTIGISWLEMWK